MSLPGEPPNPLKRAVRAGAREIARALGVYDKVTFLDHLPYYWNHFRSSYLAQHASDELGTICFDNHIKLSPPDNALATAIFNDFAFKPETREETKRFLALSHGCTALWDIGAHFGYFSALFVKSRAHGARVVSVEPHPSTCAVLRSCRARNTGRLATWHVEEAAVGAEYTAIQLRSGPDYLSIVEPAGSTISVPALRLEDLFARYGSPDIVKLDVESMEYEIVLSSRAFLRKHRPRLHLELHSTYLSRRGLRSRDVLRTLAEIGYRPFHTSRNAGCDWFERVAERSTVRLDLAAE